MSCNCKKEREPECREHHENRCSGGGITDWAFILILFILLAIIMGGAIY